MDDRPNWTRCSGECVREMMCLDLQDCHADPPEPDHHPIGCICAACSASYESDAVDPRSLHHTERA